MVEPVQAASVVLLRHGQPVGQPWQCYMVRRHVKSDFAADVFVFPGGKVDEADRDPALDQFTVGHPGPPEDTDDRDSWRALRLAALRELFEEAGVLIARSRDGAELDPVMLSGAALAEKRGHLQRGALSLIDLAVADELFFPLDRFHLFSRWITPESFPRRFDTWFFAVLMPRGQEPAFDRRETTDGVWIAPNEALQLFRRGEFPLVFATEKHLERMARYPSIEGLLAAVSPADLAPVVPKVVQSDHGTRFLLPGDEGY